MIEPYRGPSAAQLAVLLLPNQRACRLWDGRIGTREPKSESPAALGGAFRRMASAEVRSLEPPVQIRNTPTANWFPQCACNNRGETYPARRPQMFSEFHLPPREIRPSPYRIHGRPPHAPASRLDSCRASSGPLSPAPMLNATRIVDLLLDLPCENLCALYLTLPFGRGNPRDPENEREANLAPKVAWERRDCLRALLIAPRADGEHRLPITQR
jgi:hypothetical protein